jgi:antitoxin component YwqK of YwqJK toxin-antitoxin module
LSFGGWVRYYENRKLNYKTNFKNGKQEGVSVSYHENGQLWEKGTWKNGKREFTWVDYNKDGTVNKQYTGTYKDGVKISD